MNRHFSGPVVFSCFLGLFSACTYDSTPPGDDKINDTKPLLMIDASGFAAQRQVQIQYTDNLGATTLQTQAEKTDSSGRFLYPLYMVRGTRGFSVLLVVDQSGDGNISTGSGDRKYQLTSAFTADTETKKLTLANTTDFAAN